MKPTINSQAKALNDYFKASENLFKMGILKNKKDFTGQLGEWIVETIYDGKRAASAIQKGWDVDINGTRVQVKSHAKAKGNSNRWSAVEKLSGEHIDELIVIVFTFDYKIKHFYKAPWQNIEKDIKKRGKKNPRFKLSWSKLKKYEVPLKQLPKQEIISIFN